MTHIYQLHTHLHLLPAHFLSALGYLNNAIIWVLLSCVYMRGLCHHSLNLSLPRSLLPVLDKKQYNHAVVLVVVAIVQNEGDQMLSLPV